MKIVSIILKIAAVISGVLFVTWGFFIGICGIGPEGDVPAIWRVLGALMFVEGIIYCVPNGMLLRHRYLAVLYYMITTVPIVIITGYLLLNPPTVAVIKEGTLFPVMIIILICGFAPLSLMVCRRQ